MATPKIGKEEQRLAILNAKRETLFTRIQIAYDLALSLEKDINDVQILKSFHIRYESLSETKKAFETLVQEIVELKLKIEPDQPPNFACLSSFDDLYDHVKYVFKLTKPKEQLPCTSNETHKSENAENNCRSIYMPKLQLIKFSGEDVSLWPVFYENFKNLIHVNANLSNAEKLQYLLGSLEGRALKCCASIPTLPDNYPVMWLTLEQNYQNKRFLASSYFEKLLNFHNTNRTNVLQNFLDHFDTNVSALKRVEIDDLADFLLTYIAISKLPDEIVSNFELLRNTDDIPKYEELAKFLKLQNKLLFNKMDKTRTSFSKPKPSKAFVSKEEHKRFCIACKLSSHLLVECKQFKSLTPEQRFLIIKNNHLCLNCFSKSHGVSSCSSKFSCRLCQMRHHTLLHRQKPISETPEHSNKPAVPSTSNNNNPSIVCTTVKQTQSKINNIVLLSTAIVQTKDYQNRAHNLRFLVDSGSMSNLITHNTCKRLGISISKYNSKILGIGETSKQIKGKTTIKLNSCLDSNFEFVIEALIVDKVTNKLPDVKIDTSNLQYLKNLPLADPTFSVPGPIDGILNAHIYGHILRSSRVTGSYGTPIAIETALGYIVMGSVPTFDKIEKPIFGNFMTLESCVEKMLQLEDISPSVHTADDDICEDIFTQTYSRDSKGRFTVALPFKADPSLLGESFSLALRRFNYLEKRFEKNPEFKSIYSDIIKDYLNQGHLFKVIDHNICTSTPSYYIPHHCVYKLTSSSTPCRIVFDSSMKTISSDKKLQSLNDLLFVGPKLQSNITTILLGFRLFPVALTADLKSMYRQIKVVPEHHCFQRILWRFNSNENISVYELNRVTFGIRSSPYLSLRTIKQLLADEAQTYPLAVTYASRDMYVDDIVCSIPTVEEAINVQFELVKLFKSGGFPISKWSSNSTEVLDTIPTDKRLSKLVDFDSLHSVLGLQWDPCSDQFLFNLNFTSMICTKRNLLSVVARIFDPLGLLSPLTLLIKLLIKDLWKINIDWDSEAPQEITNQWLKIQTEINVLSSYRIPRFALCADTTKLDLIGFCDASQSGLGCVVYARTRDIFEQPRVQLLFSRAKVAPSKGVTLPRLELNAAVLVADMLSYIEKTFSPRVEIGKIYAFSDSMVCLSWINSSSSHLPIYIANRVTKIRLKSTPIHWYFIPGKYNIADCTSRGLTPQQIFSNNSWVNGPPWLYFDENEWPITPINTKDLGNFKIEQSAFVVLKSNKSVLYSIIEYFSSWTKMLNSTVYVLRFIKLLKSSKEISFEDLTQAEFYLLSTVQKSHFSQEFVSLSRNHVLPNCIRKLRPFICDGLIRVGGRLSNSKLGYETQHPVLLPKSDPLVNNLIDYIHRKNCHAGPTLTLALLRQRYWILSARQTVRSRIWACNYCFKFKPRFKTPYMADLPTPRVNQYKAFFHTGVDFTGAFHVTMSRHRGVRSLKAYVCLFICLSTKAIHLELVSELSTEAFIAAFKRFLARRGNVHTLYSDNATNFVGAKAQLDEVYTLLQTQNFKKSFQNEMNIQRIHWKFNPPTASHFGGIWESNIKSTKNHLRRVIGAQILTFEEFSTVLAQVEALLNSRPLCVLSEDPAEPVALTPAHFLHGSPLHNFPAECLDNTKMTHLKRFKLLDGLVQSYWKRWHLEYLTTLQIRQKWNTPTNPVLNGMIVLIVQDNIPPLQWPLAKIIEVYPGKDNIVRVALVQTKSARYVRPVAKLCPLPSQ